MQAGLRKTPFSHHSLVSLSSICVTHCFPSQTKITTFLDYFLSCTFKMYRTDLVNLVLDKDNDMTAKEKLFVLYFVCIWWNWSNSIYRAITQVCDTQYLLWVCDPQDFSTKPTNKCYRLIHRCEFWYRNMSRLVYALPVLNLKSKF